MRQRLDNRTGNAGFRMLTRGNQVLEHTFHTAQISEFGLDLRQARIGNVAD
jgi:hypothetical protein